jgi:histone arginine demethylase JMJD6
LRSERIGSSLHIDPLATSAWNTLLTGVKRWVLFHPSAPRREVKGEHLRRPGEDNEAITYFTKILPRIKEDERNKPGGPTLGMREVMQYPGETIFVPNGWHHAVLNLEDTMAVTQNFSSRVNFSEVWRKTRVARKHMARRWLQQLDLKYPFLGDETRAVDRADKFEFVFKNKKLKRRKAGLKGTKPTLLREE